MEELIAPLLTQEEVRVELTEVGIRAEVTRGRG